ncbi:dynein light chain Tctex-type 4 [Erpetoichthys calabaricus]|uniref:Tctex1 domain-containing protein 4 n=1 Tax=Erpetoichthys calabaricus TaxID=27687 RepID=A0A8C4SB39_ERPCA|nr:dynein light chain Tctex-type 4 [Erpetoichthys calabaricus]XP_051789108.1 dynein light chain Tctex-type 4 [Erpetoichthys calabaricus]
MAAKQLPLSQETLAEFNNSLNTENPGASRTRAGSISTRRSSQSVDLIPKPMPHLKDAARNVISSRRNSILNNSIPFGRRESISMGKRLSIGPWMLGGRVSFSGLPLCPPVRVPQFENTYKTEPDDGCQFDTGKVQHLLDVTVASFLRDKRYNPITCSQLTQSLADLIKNKAKELNPPRFKLVCNVILGQLNDQGVKIASRSLWDPKYDNFAITNFKNSSLFAVAAVYGVYCE